MDDNRQNLINMDYKMILADAQALYSDAFAFECDKDILAENAVVDVKSREYCMMACHIGERNICIIGSRTAMRDGFPDVRETVRELEMPDGRRVRMGYTGKHVQINFLFDLYTENVLKGTLVDLLNERLRRISYYREVKMASMFVAGMKMNDAEMVLQQAWVLCKRGTERG